MVGESTVLNAVVSLFAGPKWRCVYQKGEWRYGRHFQAGSHRTVVAQRHADCHPYTKTELSLTFGQQNYGFSPLFY